MNRFGCFLALLTLLLASMSACKSGKKTPLVEPKANNSVVLESDTGTLHAFSIKAVQAQNRNGLIYVAIVSDQGSMIQLNEISEKMLKTGMLSGNDFRLVYLPGGNQPACMGTNPLNNRLTLKVEGEEVHLQLWGQIQCTSFTFVTKAQVQFKKPQPEFIMPNQ
jgi:hypothetical protein